MDKIIDYSNIFTLHDFRDIGKAFHNEYNTNLKLTEINNDTYNYFIKLFLKHNNVLMNCEPFVLVKNGIARARSTVGLHFIGFEVIDIFDEINTVDYFGGNVRIFKLENKELKLHEQYNNVKAIWCDKLKVWKVKLNLLKQTKNKNNLFLKVYPRPIMSNDLFINSI